MIADAVTRALRAVDRDVLRPGGWDAPPRLYLLQGDPASDLEPRWLSSYEKVVASAPAGATPRDLLLVYARVVGNVSEVYPGRVEAVALAAEAWGVSVSATNIGHRDQVGAAAADRLIHQRPDRVEMRIVSSVDRKGVVRTFMYERGSEDRPAESVNVNGLDDPGFAVEGAVLEGLAAVLGAFVKNSPG